MEKLIISSILLVSDVIPMSEQILKFTQPLTEIDPKFRDLHNQTKSIFERLVKNMKSSGKSSLTKDVFFANKNRGNDFICFRDIVHGMSVSTMDDISGKAAKLYAVIDKYGAQTYALGYKAESATLLALFTEFDRPENQQLISDLGILAFYNSLKESENAFISVSNQKSDEKTVQTNESEAATDILPEIFPALTNLVSMLQLYSQLEPATYGDIYKQVVTSITEINTVARARKTRKQNISEAKKADVKA
jgi:hypothetical protein